MFSAPTYVDSLDTPLLEIIGDNTIKLPTIGVQIGNRINRKPLMKPHTVIPWIETRVKLYKMMHDLICLSSLVSV